MRMQDGGEVQLRGAEPQRVPARYVVSKPGRPLSQDDLIARHTRKMAEGDRLRRALIHIKKAMNISTADLARLLNRKPSGLYNLENYQCHGLGHTTMVRLGAMVGRQLAEEAGLPGFEKVPSPLPELAQVLERLQRAPALRALPAPDPDAPKTARDPSSVEVKLEINDHGPRIGGLYLPRFPPRQVLQGFVAPKDTRWAFGARILGRAGELAYPSGTVLVCLASRPHRDKIVPGRRVVLRHKWLISAPTAPSRFITEVREVREDAAGRTWLEALAYQPTLDERIPLPDPKEIDWSAPDTGAEVRVMGIVATAIIPEG